MSRRKKADPASSSPAGPVIANRTTREFDALLVALRRAVQGTKMTLATHRTLAELRVSLGEHRITAWLLPDGPVMMLAKTSRQMKLSDPGPLSADDVEPWARKLADFIVRQVQP